MTGQRIRAGHTGGISQRADGPAVAVTGVVLGNITIGDTVYTIEDTPVAPPPFAGDPSETPSRLLAAHLQTVTFFGREEELEALEDWRDQPAAAMRIWLVHGRAGQGKTRLALRFAQLSASAGWRVAQARHGSAASPQPAGPEPTADGGGLLLVVDYAERWPTEHLLAVLAAPVVRGCDRVRVLLISRQAGEWWQAIRHELTKLTPDVTQRPLESLAPDEGDKVRVFVAARNEFARILEVDASDIPPPAGLSRDAFDQVLSIHMAALVCVHARRAGGTTPADPARLSTYLLDREQAAWHTLHRRGVVTTAPTVMARAVTTAILSRALPAADAVTVLGQAGVADPGAAATVLDDHGVCYPPTRPGLCLEPLYPDRLAEDFLALMLPGHEIQDFHVPPSVALWAETLLANLLSAEPRPWLREAVTVLIETAHRWQHVAERHLFPLLREHPELVVGAGGAAIIRLVALPVADLGVLAAIDSALPGRRHVELDSAIAVLSERAVQLAMRLTPDRTVWAALLNTHGRRLAYAGRPDRAEAVFRRVIRTCAALDERDPDGPHGPDAAYAYDMRGLMLVNLGRPAEAVEPGRTAVARYRTLARRDRGHLPRLAGALSNLGLALTHHGEVHDAIVIHREALRIRRRLHQRDPHRFADELAISLSNLGGDLSRVNQHAEALAMTLESLELRRRLAAGNPETYGAEVAISLNNLAGIHLRLGRRGEALAAAREAVEIRLDLARVNPTAFEPDLASALNNLGGLQMDLGRAGEAATTFARIVEIYRRLALADPVAYVDRQATATSRLAMLKLRDGHAEEARDLALEALALERHMAQVAPARRRHQLVVASTYLIAAWCALGDRAEARAAAGRILDQGRAWAAAGDGPGNPVALAFDVLRQELAAVDLDDAALAAAELSVATYRSSGVAPDDDTTARRLAGALLGLGACLREAGRHAEALHPVREAVTLIGPHAERTTGKVRTEMVRAKVLESLLGYETGDYDAAVEAGVAAYEMSLGVTLSANTADTLAAVLDLTSEVLAEADHATESAQAREWAEAIRSREVPEDSEEVVFDVF